MTIKRTLVDDHDGSEIVPGAFHIAASFTLEMPGGVVKSGELDFASFDNLIAYVQAEQAALTPAPAPTPTPAPTP